MAQPTRVQALLEYLRAMDQALSRTARTGAAATSVHPAKKPSRVTGDDLRHALERNRATAAAFIDWKSEHTPHRATEISAAFKFYAPHACKPPP